MTAKEKLRQAIEALSEREAKEALDYIVRHRGCDPLVQVLDNAPEDDEGTTPEEDAGVRDAKAEIERGEVLSAEKIKRELT